MVQFDSRRTLHSCFVIDAVSIAHTSQGDEEFVEIIAGRHRIDVRLADHVGRCQIKVATSDALGESSHLTSICLDDADESKVKSCRVIGNISLSLVPI